MHDVANGMKVESYDISDDPQSINDHLKNVFKKPILLNINTVRKFWHAGAGTDGENFDRYKDEMNFFGNDGIEIDKYYENLVKSAWKKQLETL